MQKLPISSSDPTDLSCCRHSIDWGIALASQQ